jgi:hypothetical protein
VNRRADALGIGPFASMGDDGQISVLSTAIAALDWLVARTDSWPG